MDRLLFLYQVVGVPDERLGEEICAWIQVKENQSISEEEIKSYCKEKVRKWWCLCWGGGGISLLIIKYCTDKSCHCCAASSMGSDFFENVFSK